MFFLSTFFVCCFLRRLPLCADHQELGVTSASTTVPSHILLSLWLQREVYFIRCKKNQFPQSLTFFSTFSSTHFFLSKKMPQSFFMKDKTSSQILSRNYRITFITLTVIFLPSSVQKFDNFCHPNLWTAWCENYWYSKR